MSNILLKGVETDYIFQQKTYRLNYVGLNMLGHPGFIYQIIDKWIPVNLQTLPPPPELVGIADIMSSIYPTIYISVLSADYFQMVFDFPEGCPSIVCDFDIL